MNQLEYVPGIGGQSVQLDGPSAFVGIAEEMRSREWDYDLGYRDLVTATRPARTVDVTFHADYDTADTLRRVADADVMARTPGTFVAQQEWRQRGYILASDVNDIHYGRLSTELKVALLDGAWWRLVDKTFMPEDTTPTYRSATGKSVTTVEAANVPLHALTVDGESVQDGTPTPSEPVDVQVVQGVNVVDISQARAQTVSTVATVSEDSVRVYTTANGSYRGATIPLSLEAGKSYHGKVHIDYVSGIARVGFRRVSDNVFVGVATGNQKQSGDYEFNLVNYDGTPVYLSLLVTWSTSEAGDATFSNLMLNEGAEVMPYTPYGSIGIVIGDTATPIDLQGNVLASLPDGTKDVLTVDSAGHVVLEKRVEIIAGGESGVSAYYNSTNLAIGLAFSSKPYPGGDRNLQMLSDQFVFDGAKGGDAAGASMQDGRFGYFFHASGSTPWYIYFKPGETMTSTADVSNWLSTHKPKFYYQKATPETIDLGYIDMPNVFDGAVVSITAEVTPTITAEWQTSPDLYLDYPHNYPYDYQKTSSTESITPSVLTPSDVRLVIYGPAVNPYVIVGDNRYQVNTTVPSGGYLTVDGRNKSIMLTLADGTVQNVFSSGVRGGGAGGGSYIFERIPAGTSEVTYDGSFGFDLGWYEEEGEPPWSQS